MATDLPRRLIDETVLEWIVFACGGQRRYGANAADSRHLSDGSADGAAHGATDCRVIPSLCQSWHSERSGALHAERTGISVQPGLRPGMLCPDDEGLRSGAGNQDDYAHMLFQDMCRI